MIPRTTILILALYLAAMTQSCANAGDIDRSSALSHDELTVMQDLLDEIIPDDRFVHLDSSAHLHRELDDVDRTHAFLRRGLEGASESTIVDFLEINRSSFEFPPSLEFGRRVRIDRDGELDALFSGDGDGWKLYYERYPDGMGSAEISRVGFSATGDQALVYVGVQSHWLAGIGHYFLLGKPDGKWRELARLGAWIS